MESVRLPRFQRAPEIATMTLTERDRALIHYVFHHRFLRSTHLLSLVPGSRQQLLRRLQLLYHHGYLERPPAQVTYYRAGSEPMVYGLGEKAMGLFESNNPLPRRRIDLIPRNHQITRLFLEHALAVSDAMVALELSCRKHNTHLIRVDARRSIRWTVPVPHQGSTTTIGVMPDSVFGLKTEAGIRWLFLEADRGTMPVQRTNLNQSSFYRKLLAYYETWRQQILKASLSRFQILTVTTNSVHVQTLIQATQQLIKGKASGLFLFADRQSFVEAEDVLQIPLLNGRGEAVSLLE